MAHTVDPILLTFDAGTQTHPNDVVQSDMTQTLPVMKDAVAQTDSELLDSPRSAS